MPQEGDKKLCGEDGCKGIKIFHERERVPGSGVGTSAIGEPMEPLYYRRGWSCDRNPRHFEKA
jgi:hypothetical protein